MRVAALFACTITVVFGGVIEIEIELNDQGCPLDSTIQKIFAHEYYCNMFKQCSNGRVIEQRCSGHLLFNIDTLQCEWPYSVDCAGRNISESIPEQNESTESESEAGDGTCNCDPAEAPEICAQSGSDGVLVAHEYCNKFYKCSGGQPVALRCPRNLCFNPYKNLCDWAENVDCGNKTISEPEDDGNDNTTEGDGEQEIDGPINDNPEEAAEICAQDNSDGVLIANEYCNWFYNCDDGKPVPQKCPSGLMFNARKNQCDWPEKVDCGNRTISEPEDDGNDNTTEDDGEQEIDGPINDNPEEAAEICAQDNSDGVLIANEFCNWFYNCDDGKPVPQKCPSGLMFNARKNQCDWPENVDCGNRTTSEPEENGNDTTTEGDGEQEIDGPINDNPAEAGAICAQNDKDGVLIAHENCDQFYICASYAPAVLTCSSPLLYNPRTERCDWPERVDCGDRVIPERNNTQSEDDESCKNCDPSEAPEICAREGSDGDLVAHENCDHYYKCYAGKPNVLRCINTLLFNPLKGWCERPEQVDCGDRIVPDNEESGNDKPTEASEICARPGSDGELVAHEDCSKFYKCSHGKPIELECQSGLKYNAGMGLCDWPNNVDCGDRQE